MKASYLVGARKFKEVLTILKNKDLETKKIILKNNLDKEYGKAHYKHFIGDSTDLIDFIDCYGDDFTRVCSNLNKSVYRRWSKCKAKMEEIICNGNAYFLTLTFNDKALEGTSKATRRRYVARVLKSNFPFYVANIDYGGKNGREHYHAIVWSFNDPRGDFKPCWAKYGFSDVRRIGDDETDRTRVAKYITKLSRHALKETTKNGESTDRLIYSRNVKKSCVNTNVMTSFCLRM